MGKFSSLPSSKARLASLDFPIRSGSWCCLQEYTFQSRFPLKGMKLPQTSGSAYTGYHPLYHIPTLRVQSKLVAQPLQRLWLIDHTLCPGNQGPCVRFSSSCHATANPSRESVTTCRTHQRPSHIPLGLPGLRSLVGSSSAPSFLSPNISSVPMKSIPNG